LNQGTPKNMGTGKAQNKGVGNKNTKCHQKACGPKKRFITASNIWGRKKGRGGWGLGGNKVNPETGSPKLREKRIRG